MKKEYLRKNNTVKTKLLLLFLLMFSVIPASFAQGIENDIAFNDFVKETEIAFFGVDYTHTYFIGKYGFKSNQIIGDYLPQQWNDLFDEQAEKFNILKVFGKNKAYYNQKLVNKQNIKMTIQDVERRIVNNTEDVELLNFKQASELAKSYPFDNKKARFGIVVFAKKLDKTKKIGQYIFVVLDLDNNDVVYIKEAEGKAKGGGMRNYWAGSYYYSLKQLRKIFESDVKEFEKEKISTP